MIPVIFLLALALTVWMQQRLLEKFGYRELTYTLRFLEEEAVEGDTVTLVETICSRKLLPLPWVKAELTAPAALEFAADQSAVSEDTRFVSSFFCLFPYRQIERRWRVSCRKRGVFEISHAVIVLTDLLSVAEISAPFPSVRADITVLPKPADIPATQDIPVQLTGAVIRARTLIPDRFAFCGIRPYTAGDAVRDIAWPATARFGEPMVRQFQETAAPDICVVMNLETSPLDRTRVSNRVLYEDAIRVCAAVIQAAAAKNIPVRFAANTVMNGAPVCTPAGTGAAAAHGLMRLLAALPDTIDRRFSQLVQRLSAERNTALVIVTAQPDEYLMKLAAAEPLLLLISMKPLPLEVTLKNVISAAKLRSPETR